MAWLIAKHQTQKAVSPTARQKGRPREGARPDSLRGTLIRSGLELLAAGSLETLSLRKVAEAAGVTHAATYRHFADRNDLFAAIAEEGYRLFYLTQEESLQAVGSDDFAERLRTLGRAYVRFVLRNPQYARIMFGQSGIEFRAYPGLVRASGRTWRRLRGVIRLGQRQGIVPRDAGRERTLAAWSMVHGIAMLLLDGQLARGASPEETEELVASVIEYTYDGISAR